MTFQQRYEKLNQQQQAAVDKIYGPLLVVAGPGTGKTELLSMRVAQILNQTDTLPSSILCLTFTDSAAANMRERLRQIIGEAAYKVAIFTFHSFGTEVINQHRQYFSSGADLKPIDELTQHQILMELFSELDWKNPLATKYNDNFTYIGDTKVVISEFKRSGLTPDELRSILNDNQKTYDELAGHIKTVFSDKISKSTIEKFAPLAELASKITSDKLPLAITPYQNSLALSVAHATQEAIDDNSTKPITAWKNTWCEKDVNGDFTLKDSLATEKLLATIDLYEKYQQVLASRQLFDYDDMILSVLRACETNEDLRANLQEKYQFIMIDEFQDTNLAQLRLLFNLTGDESQPNVMAVGDDDQAIYSFQGADVGNIQRFRQQYNDPEIIVLTDNYRSTEEIVRHARSVITQGVDRLENTVAGLSKELTTHFKDPNTQVNIHRSSSPADERADVARLIAEKIASGAAPESIAVLSRKHAELIELLPYLTKQRISVNYERQDNILEQELIVLLEDLSRIILAISTGDHNTANVLLPKVVAHPSFGFSAQDIWKVSLKAHQDRQLWLETMQTNPVFKTFSDWLIEIGLTAPTRLLEQQLDQLLGQPKYHKPEPDTDDEPFSQDPGAEGPTAYLSPIASYFFSSDKLAAQPDAYLTALEALRTLRDRLREHYDSQRPTLAQLIEFIDLHRSTGTRITSSRAGAANQTGAINLMSVHKAKGLEFDHVFIIGATENMWGERARGRSRMIRYPANLTLAPAGASYDERLKLFFVAMTRAKISLSISFAEFTETEKATLVAGFLSQYETIESSNNSQETAVETIETDWRSDLVSPMTGDLRAILAPALENYKLSVTHLNNFLDIASGGPQNFLLNNLLHFPQAKSPSSSYGSAIHVTLQFAHDHYRTEKKLPTNDQLVEYFTKYLTEQRLDGADEATFLDKGKQAIDVFMAEKSQSFSENQLTELNFSNQGVVLHEARLTGALDLADIDPQQKTIFVTDYKTGKPSRDWKGKTDWEKIKLHKYRQQLMFYQLLIENSRDYSQYRFIGARLQFVEPEQKTGNILDLEDSFTDDELEQFKTLISAVWQKITNLDLPDTSSFTPDYKGMVEFERSLLDMI